MDLSTRVDALMVGLTADPEPLTALASIGFARAEPNLRFHPSQDPREARGLLVTHLEALGPSGVAPTAEAAFLREFAAGHRAGGAA